jgi:hypothetical protein
MVVTRKFSLSRSAILCKPPSTLRIPADFLFVGPVSDPAPIDIGVMIDEESQRGVNVAHFFLKVRELIGAITATDNLRSGLRNLRAFFRQLS